MADGFYPWALDETATAMRWTKDVATIRAPWPEVDTATPVTGCLRLDLSNWRDNGAPLHLVVEVEGRQVYAGSLAEPMGRQTLDLPLSQLANEGSSDLEIRLYSSTFIPQDPNDPRELGMLLYGRTTAACRSMPAAIEHATQGGPTGLHDRS